MNSGMSRFGARAQITLLAILVAYFFIWPLWRLLLPIEIAQTEGWNAYHADMAMRAALQLYPPQDTLIVNNYPPLSFFVVGYAQYLFGDALYIGRVLSVIATLGVGALIGRVVTQLGGSRTAGIIAALWFVATMVRSFHHYVGADEPQIVAHLIMMAGLSWFLARDNAGKSFEGPVLLMVIAGFYKHNILAVPAAVFLSLLLRNGLSAGLRDWPRFWRPLIVGIAAGALGLAICLAIWGQLFIANIFTPRPQHWIRAIMGLGRLQFILPAMVLWAIYAWSDRTSRVARFTVLYVAIALALYLLQWTGEAILDSAQFDLVIATGVGLGVAYDRAWTGAFARRYGLEAARAVIVVILLVRLVATTHIESFLLIASPAYRAEVAAHAQAARTEIKTVAAIQGPVGCDFKVICRFAGKPFVYDDFRTEMLVSISAAKAAADKTGATRAVTEADLIREHGLTFYKNRPESGIVSLQRVLFGRVE
jgi:hypothetical protein